MSWRARNHTNFLAFAVHRGSGLLLALFLPFHFWALGSAISGAARFDGILAWTTSPLVKLAETGLVILLAAHLAGGVRLLALELLAWRRWQKTAVSVSAGFSLAVGLLFLLNVF
jgi:fumarate reductase subunit D